ncbi:MAG: heparinase II/III family protein [Trueperaceae bacterium]|nr:heparinase II/III family protein [Trueperaceae bacterium]
MKWVQLLVVLLCIAVFAVVVGHHYREPIRDISLAVTDVVRERRKADLRRSNACRTPEETIRIDGGFVCRGEVAAGPFRSIFDEYPALSGGRDQIYGDVVRGSVTEADKLLQNVVPVDRYPDFEWTSGITWGEGIPDEPYWQYLYFGFGPMRHLFAAFEDTLDPIYLLKVMEIVLNFSDEGSAEPLAWLDSHAVAFRSLFLVKTWWKMREYNLISYEDSEAILRLLVRHADYLADPNNAELSYTRGVNQSAALMLIASNFPELDHGGAWARRASEHLEQSVRLVVDQDGVLVANSPYYHFNALEKLWQIYTFSVAYGPRLSDEFGASVHRMLFPATYLLKPDRSLPLLGASTARRINYSGLYRELADAEPGLLYVLTDGAKGIRPSEKSALFPSSGLAVLRSGWSAGSSDVYVAIDVGSYRTNHSDLDALSFVLYASEDLIQDAGLFTYGAGAEREYFHGTRGHNTVLVDGRDQFTGDVDIGDFVVSDDYSSISASHRLNPGVTHSRSFTLIRDRYLLIVDNLVSDEQHEYRQLFHLGEGVSTTVEGATLHVGRDGRPLMALHQLDEVGLEILVTTGQTDPIQGVCSQSFGTAYECPTAEFIKRSDSAVFVTLIEIGTPDPTLVLQIEGGVVSARTRDSNLTINYAISPRSDALGELTVDWDEPELTGHDPAQPESDPSVVIVFDDGYRSILPAIEVMRRQGFAGNIAVIADRVEGRINSYLDVPTLRSIQDEYGWNIVNHSRHHVPAASYHDGPIGLEGLANDVMSGARFLIENGLNSAPNWYIFPFGSHDFATRSVIGRYYQLARVTTRGDAAVPLANPLAVTTVSSDLVRFVDGVDIRWFLPVEEMIALVGQAIGQGRSIFVTFHRIRSLENDPPGYELTDFETFIDYLAAEGIRVRTLSEFAEYVGYGPPVMVLNDTSIQIEIDVQYEKRSGSWIRTMFGL